MKLIKVRDSIDSAHIGAASMGYNDINYQEVAMTEDPDKYWFIITVEFTVVFLMALLSQLDFPLIEAVYQRILMFRNAHKFKAYIIFFLIIPILAVGFILLLLFLFDL